jgi:hypothetical protein
MMRTIAGLLYGRDDGHLDHLAPTCSNLNIPLFVTSETLYSFALKQYPDLTCILAGPNQVATLITKDYDTIISTLPRQMIDPIFLIDELAYKKRLSSFWLPHGASDKDNMKALTNEDFLLVYGRKMRSMLPKQAQEKAILTGNTRLQYFIKHKNFYDDLIPPQWKKTDGRCNILYAPSWESDPACWINLMIAQRPPDSNLFIKLHPNSYKTGAITALALKYEGCQGVVFIQDFFPIYPLLAQMDALYTDTSSIGYDFLVFDKPLFFTDNCLTPLHSCGTIANKQSLFTTPQPDLFRECKAKLYAEVFEDQ